jgi:hypothetical protein
MKIPLPERDYLTFGELAQRWRCLEGDVKHYIFEKQSLKASIKIDNKNWGKYVDKYSARQSNIAMHVGKAGGRMEGAAGNVEREPRRHSIREFTKEHHLAQKYYFLNTDYLVDYLSYDNGSIRFGTDFLEDENGDMYRLYQDVAHEYYYTKLDVSEFSIVVIDEIKRFEEENNIQIIVDGLEEPGLNASSEEKDSMQIKREIFLRGYLKGINHQEGIEIELRREELWGILSTAAPDLFPLRGSETVNEFFKKQNYCKFKPGRPKEKGVKAEHPE